MREGSPPVAASREDPQAAGILPGSRGLELRRHWEILTRAAAASSSASISGRRGPRGGSRVRLHRRRGRGIRVVSTGLHPILASADLALVASGTATLEAALCGAPMVVFYKTSSFSWAIARALVRLRWASS